MFEKWKVSDFAPGDGMKAGVFREDHDSTAWLDAPAPGDVHQALIDGGRIQDPFFDCNESSSAWIEDREWWYRTSFTVTEELPGSDERLHLIFHGLDTYATVWLNGQELGTHRNMFRPATFDVTERIRPNGHNVLAIRFDRPMDHVAGFDVDHWWLGKAPRVAMRKAQFGYGWDWGPRLPTIGIWRPVELRRLWSAAVTGVHFYTVVINKDEDLAVVAVQVEADLYHGSASLQATIQLHEDNRLIVSADLSLEGTDFSRSATAYMTLRHPRLWWTNDLGQPYLYSLSVELHQAGKRVDEYTMRVGIRTITLDQSPDPDEPGTRFFRFVLNGIPIFARGANWIPAHSFVGAITHERYARLLRLAKDANMNMMRVWGGGIYEHDSFYTLCDQFGLLVWQDFMFACAQYPEQPKWFVDEVAAEVKYQIRRLRSRPCMALWCGNNENQWLHERTAWREADPIVPGALYYDEIMPDAVHELDGQIPYWPGSPYGGNDYNSEEDGDSHNWNVWHGNSPRRFGEQPIADHSPEGVSYRRYSEDMSRFASEFGMHAAPVFETLRRNIPVDQLYHHSPSMDHHNKDDPKNKGDSLMLSVTGLPETLEEYIDFSMVAQAEGLKFGIEHFRRRKPHCSGTLFWQFNDCWPVLSWSVVDYYGFGKAGYYYVRRAFAPIVASFQEVGDGLLSLWVTNDTLSDIHDVLTLSLRSFQGDMLWSTSTDVHIPANCSCEVWSGKVEGGIDRYVTVRGETTPANRHFFVPIKDLGLPSVELEVEMDQVDAHEVHVHLRAEQFAYLVHVLSPSETTQFSDNYFDLGPGEERMIQVRDPLMEIQVRDLAVRKYVRQM